MSNINKGHPPRYGRFRPGQSGNPSGRPKNVGVTIREWLNLLAEATEADIRAIVTDPAAPWPKRTAALRVLRSLETSDLADFEDMLSGSIDLAGLRAQGVNTDVVKKFKQRTRTTISRDGATETTIEREIELHDRSGIDFDRLLDRTIGKPVQAVSVPADCEGITFQFVKVTSA